MVQGASDNELKEAELMKYRCSYHNLGFKSRKELRTHKKEKSCSGKKTGGERKEGTKRKRSSSQVRVIIKLSLISVIQVRSGVLETSLDELLRPPSSSEGEEEIKLKIEMARKDQENEHEWAKIDREMELLQRMIHSYQTRRESKAFPRRQPRAPMRGCTAKGFPEGP